MPGSRPRQCAWRVSRWLSNSIKGFVIRSLLPLMEKFGIATAKEIDIDSLADRLAEEFTMSRGSLVIPEFIGAWARLGG